MQSNAGLYGIPKPLGGVASEIVMFSNTGTLGSTDTSVKYFETIAKQVGTSVKVRTDTVVGTQFIIVDPGIYTIYCYGESYSAAVGRSITRNANPTSGNVSTSAAGGLVWNFMAANTGMALTVTTYLYPNDVIRYQFGPGGNSGGSNGANIIFGICKHSF